LTCRGAFTSEDAWNLLAKLICHIFKDMALVWAEARDIGSDLKDSREYTMAMVIWVTLKMHEIMDEYMDHNFEHASPKCNIGVGSVLGLELCQDQFRHPGA